MSAFMPSVHWHFRLPTLHHPEASSLRRCQGPAWCVRTVCLMRRSDDACTSAHLPSHTIQGPGPSSTSRGRLAPSSAVTSLSSLGEAAWAMASAKNTGLFNHWACLTFFLIRKKKTFESFYLKFKCSPYMHLPVSQKEKWKMPGKHKLTIKPSLCAFMPPLTGYNRTCHLYPQILNFPDFISLDISPMKSFWRDACWCTENVQ